MAKKVKAKCPVTEREIDVARAREVLGDQRLLAFLRACRAFEGDVHACRFINQELDRGDDLDAIFYTGSEYGFHLFAESSDTASFTIEFGCQAGPLAGDGGEWLVSFNPAGDVREIELGRCRLS